MHKYNGTGNINSQIYSRRHRWMVIAIHDASTTTKHASTDSNTGTVVAVVVVLAVQSNTNNGLTDFIKLSISLKSRRIQPWRMILVHPWRPPSQLPTIINITVGRGDDNVTNNPGGTVKDTVRWFGAMIWSIHDVRHHDSYRHPKRYWRTIATVRTFTAISTTYCRCRWWFKQKQLVYNSIRWKVYKYRPVSQWLMRMKKCDYDSHHTESRPITVHDHTESRPITALDQ